jgi:hypothetical protein
VTLSIKEHFMKLSGLFLVGVLFLVLLVGCDLEKPSMPKWDINVDLPLINDYLYVSDLVDSVHFFQNGNDIYFSSHGNVNSFLLNNLELQPHTEATIPLFADLIENGTMSLASIASTNQVKVAYGRVISGDLVVTSSNLSEGFQSAVIQFNELYTSNGQNLTIHVTNEGTLHVSLAGIYIGTITNTAIIENLHYSITNESSLAAGTPIGEIDLTLNQVIHFDNFIGLMNNFSLDVQNETTSITIDYPLGIENAMQITDASLQMNLLNEIGFDCELHGKLYAYNDNTGAVDSVSILDDNNQPFVLSAAVSESNPTPSTFILHDGLHQLMSIIPTRFAVGNAYFVMRNSSESLGFAHIGQRVTGTYIEHVPFNFTLFDSEITPNRVDSLEITQENRNYIRNNAHNASLALKVKNQLPIGMGFEIDFSSSPSVFENPELIRSATINSGGYDSAYQEINMDLTHDDLQVFDNPKIYYKTKIHFHPTDGPVVITGSSSDYIQVIGRIHLNALVEVDGK